MVKIKVKVKTGLRLWLEITRPLNKLTDKELEYMTEALYASLLYKTNNFSGPVQQYVRKQLDVKKDSKVLHGLFKKKAIVNNVLNKAYVPKIRDGKIFISYELNMRNE